MQLNQLHAKTAKHATKLNQIATFPGGEQDLYTASVGRSTGIAKKHHTTRVHKPWWVLIACLLAFTIACKKIGADFPLGSKINSSR